MALSAEAIIALAALAVACIPGVLFVVRFVRQRHRSVGGFTPEIGYPPNGLPRARARPYSYSYNYSLSTPSSSALTSFDRYNRTHHPSQPAIGFEAGVTYAEFEQTNQRRVIVDYGVGRGA